MSYCFDNFDDFIYFENNREQPFKAGPATESHQDVLRVKRAITQDGYLTYHDAFALGNWYLDQFPHLCEALSLRFPFVFIDEMQDTDQYQHALIDKIFLGRSVVQKFGDANQAIYDHRSEEFECVWNPHPDYQITSSRRLSCTIARLTQSLGVTPQTIRGNPAWGDHNHTIICFDAYQAQQVIPTFAGIVEQEGLLDGPFMALGAVAKQHQLHLTVLNYWPSFERRLNRKTTTSSFWEYLSFAHCVLSQEKDLVSARNYLLNAIAKVLRSQNSQTRDNHPFTAAVFETEVSKKGQQQTFTLNRTLLCWVQQLFQTPIITADQLIPDLQTVLGLIDIQLAPKIIGLIRQGPTLNPQPSAIIQEPHSPTNIYLHSENIAISVNTIHSAKGQTHQATLLLETFYKKYDLHQIKSYLWGQAVRKPGVTIQQRYLPLAYVACTRPTHLLCMAIQRGHLNDDERIKLKNFGWRIMDI